ncbi:MAG: hypothetical protein K0R29_476 [Pseudobdellovibrio sp.]|nr:hypothetical protein [Pseudobdellovibrio sp.]
MKNKETVNKNQTEKKKLPPNASAINYDRDKNQTYWPKDESVEPPEHKSRHTNKVSPEKSAE